jgi:hypothetical protein
VACGGNERSTQNSILNRLLSDTRIEMVRPALTGFDCPFGSPAAYSKAQYGEPSLCAKTQAPSTSCALQP